MNTISLEARETGSAKFLGLELPELRQGMPCAGCYMCACHPKELTPNLSKTKGGRKPASSGCWEGERGEGRSRVTQEMGQGGGIESNLNAVES